MAPSTPKSGHCSSHVLRRKRRSVHAPAFLDEVDRRGERTAYQIAVPHTGQREPRALHRKDHRNDIAESVTDSRIRHHCPITIQIAAVIENPSENQQINKIGEISKLHEFVQRRICELFQPQGGIHAGQPGVTRCTSFPSSSKQNKKNKCGYQCRQKCQNFCAAVGQTEGSVALRASIRHKISIRAATSACTPINLKGWPIFSANAAISALDAAK